MRPTCPTCGRFIADAHPEVEPFGEGYAASFHIARVTGVCKVHGEVDAGPGIWFEWDSWVWPEGAFV